MLRLWYYFVYIWMWKWSRHHENYVFISWIQQFTQSKSINSVIIVMLLLFPPTCVFQCKVNLQKKSLNEDDDDAVAVKVYVQSFENSIFVFFNFYIFSVNRSRRHATHSLTHMRDTKWHLSAHSEESSILLW